MTLIRPPLPLGKDFLMMVDAPMPCNVTFGTSIIMSALHVYVPSRKTIKPPDATQDCIALLMYTCASVAPTGILVSQSDEKPIMNVAFLVQLPDRFIVLPLPVGGIRNVSPSALVTNCGSLVDCGSVVLLNACQLMD
jgi:hypothetical protein